MKNLLQMLFLVLFGALMIFLINVLEQLGVINDWLLAGLTVFGLAVATMVGRDKKKK